MHRSEAERRTPSPYLVAWHHESPLRLPDTGSIALFAEIRELSDAALMRFLKHDLDNLLGKSTVGIQGIFEGGTEIVRPILRAADSVFPKVPDGPPPLPGEVQRIKVLPVLQYDMLRDLESAVASIPSDLPLLPEMEKALASEPMNGQIHQAVGRSRVLLNSFKRLAPIFTASMRFLYAPNDKDYEFLQRPSVHIRELTEYFRVSSFTVGSVDRLLTGSETIVLFNLLQNAQKFHRNVPDQDAIPFQISADEETGTYTVINASTAGIRRNKQIFRPGKKGENGNTGYGLTIAKLYALLNGYDITRSSTRKSKGLYKISFTFGIPEPEQPAPLPANGILFTLPPAFTRAPRKLELVNA